MLLVIEKNSKDSSQICLEGLSLFEEDLCLAETSHSTCSLGEQVDSEQFMHMIQRSIVQDVFASHCYSIKADETADISLTEQVSTCI